MQSHLFWSHSFCFHLNYLLHPPPIFFPFCIPFLSLFCHTFFYLPILYLPFSLAFSPPCRFPFRYLPPFCHTFLPFAFSLPPSLLPSLYLPFSSLYTPPSFLSFFFPFPHPSLPFILPFPASSSSCLSACYLPALA